MSKPEQTRVKDALLGAPNVINGLATVREALAIMEECGRDALIIDKRGPDDEYGLITITDIARDVVAQRRNLDRVNVYEVMEKPAVSVLAQMQARYAMRLLCRLGFHNAIVVEDDTMIGCVSLRDLSLAIMRAGKA